MKDDTTYGFSPEGLSKLLALGLQGGDPQNDLLGKRTPAEALQAILSNELPLDPAMPDSLLAVLKRPCEEIFDVADQTMGDLLFEPKTDLAVIKALKDYSKELVHRGGPEARQAAATAIYYATIANALVYHQQKVTQHSHHKLHEAYADLEQKPWIPSELRNLFRKAQALCQ